ncbi:MAG: penicillin-binding protein 2 [Candidatus Pelagibacter sp. TMED106]|nr:MAG: penicillin-binding protein 2 [Candidatus Pelagibacter sp. TMED106]
MNQKSFYFEDYLETNQKKNKIKNSNITQDRVYLLFFLFFSLITIFSIKIVFVSLKSIEIYNKKNNSFYLTPLRRDIIDRNGTLVSRNVKSFHAAINPNLIKNKENFLINIRLNFPDLPIEQIEKKLNEGKYFYLKRRLDQNDKEKLWSLGEKGIIFEPFQSRIYTHANLYSHILGQVDYDNYGISGVEKYFDKELKDKKLLNSPLQLTLDTNIQHIIDDELNRALKTFNATGGGALLMDVNNGEVLSLVSLPNFNINKRANITDKNYTNKITKGVYELGSIFKTFTIALAIEKGLVSPETIIKDIPRKIKCSIHEISDIKQFPKDLSVEDILIRSSNIGTLMLAKKIGEQDYKDFIKETNLLDTPEFELEEIGTPLNFKWNKCKLETISYGHGIAVTPLQASTTYAALTNGGNIIKPTLIRKKEYQENKKIVSLETSKKINTILRKVVTEKEGTASLADIYGYDVGGKTGTSQKYGNKNENLNTFISVFPSQDPKYVLLVMLENPQVASDLIYNYRGIKIKGTRNEAGWNSVYIAGKIIKKIGPILAIKNKEFYNKHVAKKLN